MEPFMELSRTRRRALRRQLAHQCDDSATFCRVKSAGVLHKVE
jgi:hypothetical protein